LKSIAVELILNCASVVNLLSILLSECVGNIMEIISLYKDHISNLYFIVA